MGMYLSVLIYFSTLPSKFISFQKRQMFLEHPLFSWHPANAVEGWFNKGQEGRCCRILSR
jgi:hypothetical protein